MKKRIFASALACVFTAGMMVRAVLPLPVDAAATVTDGRVSDGNTTTTYTAAFGDGSSTRYSGRVWTDKTVYTEKATFTGMVDGQQRTFEVTNDSDFLVAYSALASSTAVVNQVPVDVVFVIDLSSSMISTSMGEENGERISRLAVLVDGLNSAIQSIMQQNQHNRVAVVGYRSAPDPDMLLPLDSYPDAVNGAAFELDRRIQVVSGDTDPDVTMTCNITGGSVTIHRSTNGGTNIQTGVYDGMNLLATAENTQVEIDGNLVTRAPYVVLMSDGLATHSSDAVEYWNPRNGTGQTVNYGLGGNLVFSGHAIKAMMTAAYMKQRIDDNYDLSAGTEYQTQVLTFGMGLSNLSEEQKAYATATLNPANATGAVAEEIQRIFQSYDQGNEPVVNTGVRFRFHRVNDSGKEQLIWREEGSDTTPGVIPNKEGRVPALGGGDPNVLFDGKDYYTYYETGGTDRQGNPLNGFDAVEPRAVVFDSTLSSDDYWSGYAYFDDYAYELTHPTGVADVSDINYNDLYYSADTAEDVTDAFRNIVTSITTGTPEVPTQVEGDPVSSGYITYTDPIGAYMEVKSVKSILWNGTVFTQYDGMSTNNVTTYRFQGEINSPVYGEHNVNEIIIQVKDETDGTQTLSVMIPASAIPLRVNTIEMKGDTVVSNQSNNAYPIRVFYTVGMKEGIIDSSGKVNSAVVSEEYLADNTNEDGMVNFYSNLYTGTVMYPDETWRNTVGEATVTFEPAATNPYYFNQEQVKLYTDPECQVPATGAWDPNGTYYRVVNYFEGEKQETAYVEINPHAYGEDSFVYDQGQLCLKAGSQRISNLARFVGEKASNHTDTAATYYYPTFESDVQRASNGMFTVYLGNNGMLYAPIARGDLSITKQVEGNRGETDQDFTFALMMNGTAGLNGEYKGTVTSSAGSENVTVTFTDGVAQINGVNIALQDGETLTIEDLPAYYTFTVTEDDPNSDGTKGYTTEVKGEYDPAADGQTITVDHEKRSASGTLLPDKMAELTYTNTWDVPVVQLTVTKTVGGNMGDTTEDFTFTLQVTDTDNESYTGAMTTTKSGTGVTGSEEETITSGGTFTLAHGQQIVIDIPNGYSATVTETAVDGYTTTADLDKADYAFPQEGGYTVTTDMTANHTVDYYNECDLEEVPTGVDTQHPGSSVMLGVATVGAVLIFGCSFLVWRRRRRDWM